MVLKVIKLLRIKGSQRQICFLQLIVPQCAGEEVISLAEQDTLLPWAAIEARVPVFHNDLCGLALVFFFTLIFCGFPSGKHDGLTVRCQMAALWPGKSMWYLVKELKAREREILLGDLAGAGRGRR